MRILFLSTDFPSPWEPNRGPFNLALVRALRRQGHDVPVVAPVPWAGKLRKSRSSLQDMIEDVSHPTYLYPPKLLRDRYDWFYWRSSRRAILRSIKTARPDVVLSYWAHPDGAVAVKAARHAGATSAIIVGGSDVLVITRDAARRRRVANALSNADRVITVSEHLRDSVMRLGVDARHVCTWSQGVDYSIFHPGDRAAARHQLVIGADELMLLWVGRMVHVKGLDVLIDAMAKLHRRIERLKLYLVGDGPLAASLKAHARRHGLGDVVRFVGAVRGPELGDWYRAANATVLPSRSEGLPNVVRESLACGTPFVASRVGGIAEIARDGIDHLVAPGEPFGLAEAIERCLSQPPAIDVPALPSWEQSADALAQLIAPPARGLLAATAPGINNDLDQEVEVSLIS